MRWESRAARPYTIQEIAADDRLWAVYNAGIAKGLPQGWDDGYRAGRQDAADEERAEWARVREYLDREKPNFGAHFKARGEQPGAVARERARRGWAA